ncbi:MAG TPA: alcohol dehydrogenase catalytic domain-containing protein [Solirubrobacterales bacterium]|nr:alcohol dehydrogenase catalytic domain-containing protein [Solirubrobacterales bacterium]
MRELRFIEPGTVRWEQAPDPLLEDPGSALVRPLAVARCDLDIAMAAFGIFPGPYPVGHEAVGEVVEVGDRVTSFARGDRVVVPFQVSCGSCRPCSGGRFAACEPFKAKAGAAFGFGEAGGGHGGAVADLLAVPAAEHLLLHVPEAISDVVACTLADNVIDGYRAVAAGLARYPGEEVLIVGGAAPSIGLYAVASAFALGAGGVRFADSDPERCAAAEALGATIEDVGEEWPRRFDRALVVVDNVLEPEGLHAALRSTDGYGFCTSVAIHFGETTPMPLLEMYTRGITYHTSRADSRRLLPEVIEMVAEGRLDPRRVPTTVAGWTEADEVWLEPAIKLVVERGAAAGEA